MKLLVFILGLNIGSFLNVLIDRLPKREMILGRSYCDHCKKTLSPYDLVPLLSFFWLGGKCRNCKKVISWQYPLVEAITGLLFVLSFISINRLIDINTFFNLILSLIIVSGLIVIFFADLKYRIIPDEILILLILASLFQNIFLRPNSFKASLISGLTLFLIFTVLFLITRGRGMGMGDVKYSFIMGFILGFPASIVAFYIAFLTGAFFSIILILKGKKRFGQTIAFGPFLVLATVVSFFWGEKLWRIGQTIIGIY